MRWTSWTIRTSAGAVSVSLKRRDCGNRAAGLAPGLAPDLGLPVVAGVLLGPGRGVDVAAVPAARSSAGQGRGQGHEVPRGVGAAALGPAVLSAGAVLARPSSAVRAPSHTRGPVPEAHLQSDVPRADLQAGHGPGRSQSRKASRGAAASPPRPTTAITPRRVPVQGLVRGQSLQSKTTSIPTTVEATCLLFHVFCTACPATLRCVLALTLSSPYRDTVHSTLVAVHFIYCLHVIKAIVRVTCVASLHARCPMQCSVDITVLVISLVGVVS